MECSLGLVGKVVVGGARGGPAWGGMEPRAGSGLRGRNAAGYGWDSVRRSDPQHAGPGQDPRERLGEGGDARAPTEPAAAGPVGHGLRPAQGPRRRFGAGAGAPGRTGFDAPRPGDRSHRHGYRAGPGGTGAIPRRSAAPGADSATGLRPGLVAVGAPEQVPGSHAAATGPGPTGGAGRNRSVRTRATRAIRRTSGAKAVTSFFHGRAGRDPGKAL